jgi:hypothetical protein
MPSNNLMALFCDIRTAAATRRHFLHRIIRIVDVTDLPFSSLFYLIVVQALDALETEYEFTKYI